MKTRRAFLASCAVALTGAAAAVTAAPKAPDTQSVFKHCPRATGGPNAKRFPQVIVQDQHKKKSWFYEELINNKLVVVNFTSVRGEEHFPVVKHLVKVQEMLEDRLGEDLFIYTISTRPYEDTPEKLKALADRHGAKWQFLTGEPTSIKEVLHAFGVHGAINGLSWVGNEKSGRWLSKATQQHPLFIAEAVARLSTGKHHKPFLMDLRSSKLGKV